MHLTHPKEPDKFTCEELRCLSRALGFHEDIFTKHTPLLTADDCFYVETKILCELAERKVFDSDLHRSFNLHDGVYNAEVLLKALQLLSTHKISFTELKTIRVAFQFYERADLTGLEINTRTILSTLKMCGRVIAPKQLTDHLRHMPRRTTDRLMMYEFMDLYQICENICDVKKTLQSQSELRAGVAPLSQYQVGNFREIFQREDQKLLDHLDQVYEKKCFHQPFGSKPTWRIPPQQVIKNYEWKKQVASNRGFRTGLDMTVNKSNEKVFDARHGGSRDQVQFIDVNMTNNRAKSSTKAELTQGIDVSATEERGHITSSARTDEYNDRVKPGTKPVPSSQFSSSAPSRTLCGNCLSDTPSYLSTRAAVKGVKVLVTQKELHATHTKIVDLLWDLEMKGEVDPKSRDGRRRRTIADTQSIIKQNEINESVQEQKEDKNAVIDQQELLKTLARDEHYPNTPTVYKFLNSRSDTRDSLLGRSSKANSQRGRSRQSRRTESVERTFLSTA